MYIKNLHQIILYRTTKGNLLSGSLSCVDFKDIFSTLEFQLWMGEPYQENHTWPCGQKVGLKERKKTKTKDNNRGLIPCVLKFHLHIRLSFFFQSYQTDKDPKLAIPIFKQWPPISAGTFQSNMLNEAACCFKADILMRLIRFFHVSILKGRRD